MLREAGSFHQATSSISPAANLGIIGAWIIRAGFWGPVYTNYNKECFVTKAVIRQDSLVFNIGALIIRIGFRVILYIILYL